MLLGSSNNRIDGKGRLVMPAKFRSKIGEIVCCTVSRNRSLAVYPMDEWAPYYEKIQALPSTDEALKFLAQAATGNRGVALFVQRTEMRLLPSGAFREAVKSGAGSKRTTT